MNDLTRLSARDAAQRIAAGTLTSEALTKACLERIAEREPTVCAWEHLDPAEALAEARSRDRAKKKGPLHGVPIAVKDLIDTEDMPTHYGSPIWRRHRPIGDAAAVALAREAGAVVLGKTVTTEFAFFHPGKTHNPHNPKHTPGGSSSGSAAAVGDFMVPLAFGTQTAGSVIRPAAFCGVVGYKPTYGTIPRAGVKPLADSLDTVGVMARSVADAAFFASVVAVRPALAEPQLAGVPRLGLCRTHQWEKAEPATADVLERVREAAARAGATVDEIAAPAEHAPLFDAQLAIMEYEAARALAWERLEHEAQLSPKLREILRRGIDIAPETYDRAQHQALEARLALRSFFGNCDGVIVPSAPGEAPEGLAATGDPAFNRIWTLLGVPCVTLPVGAGPKGLPLGVQLVGRLGDDARLLGCAAWLERALAS